MGCQPGAVILFEHIKYAEFDIDAGILVFFNGGGSAG